MKYIVCEKPGTFILKEKQAPLMGEGEALLKIKQVGICGTDLHAFAGNQPFFSYPRILGHELSAEIIEIDSNDKGLMVGDKVMIMPYISCGNCISCRSGKTNCCTRMKVLGVHVDGGMQEIITAPIDLLLPAGKLNDEEIAIVEPLAIGAHALRRADLQKDEFVLVIGCGPIGIGIMKMAQINGAKVIAMDVSQERLNYAQREIGVDHIVKADENAIVEIRKITSNDLATAVFDATGNKYALEKGIEYMSHGGRYILVGLSKGQLSFDHPSIHAKESTIMCSRNATLEDFKKVKSLLETGLFPTESFVTHQVNFDQMIDSFESWLKIESGVIKAMIKF